MPEDRFSAKGVQVQKTLTVKEGLQMAYRIKAKEISKKAQQDYKSYLGVFVLWLESHEKVGVPIADFRQAEMYQFLDWLLEVRGNGNRTRNNYRDFMGSLFNVLMMRELIIKNPCKGIADLKVKAARHVPYTNEERAELLRYLHRQNRNLYYFIQFVYFGFIRRSELLKLRVRDIDFKNHIIMVWSGNAKNKKQLPVVINPGLMRVIEEMELASYPGRMYVFGKALAICEELSPINFPTRKHSAVLKKLSLYDGEKTLYSHKHSGVCAAF